MSQIKLGNFKLHSGAESDFKIDMDAATDQDIEGYAFLINKFAGPFGSVEGVPRGGLRLAEALKKYLKKASLGPFYHELDSAMTCVYCNTVAEKLGDRPEGRECRNRRKMAELPYPHLIVDDVLTTGGSTHAARDAKMIQTKECPVLIIGAVVYARGPCPPWITPLFQLPRQLWSDPSPGWIPSWTAGYASGGPR